MRSLSRDPPLGTAGAELVRMPHALRRSSLLLLLSLGVAWTADPPLPNSPDPIPPAVRTAATKLAQVKTAIEFTLVQHQGVLLYEARLRTAKDGDEVLATFAADGGLVGVRPLPPAQDDLVPQIPAPAPLPDVPPRRLDGRDADPETRRGVDPTDHS